MQILGRNMLKLCAAGVLIGYLHSHDALLAGVLAVYMMLVLGKRFLRGSADRYTYLTGLALSALFGVLCEFWGIYYGYWTYHDLSGEREFPYWLPFAWGLAFTFIYKIEKELFSALSVSAFWHKVSIALLVAMVFPTVGEIITINMGVWTYSWPYQLLGVPMLAIFLLMVFHMGVNLLMTLICRTNNWQDPVFNP
jgi:hypothetical protein